MWFKSLTNLRTTEKWKTRLKLLEDLELGCSALEDLDDRILIQIANFRHYRDVPTPCIELMTAAKLIVKMRREKRLRGKIDA